MPPPETFLRTGRRRGKDPPEMEIAICELNVYLLARSLGRAQLEAMGKGIWCPSGLWPEQWGWGYRAAPAGGLQRRWQLLADWSEASQDFALPCGSPVPSQGMYSLHFLKRCLSKAAKSCRKLQWPQVGFRNCGHGDSWLAVLVLHFLGAAPLVKFASIPGGVEQWAGWGVLPERPPKSPGASGAISYPILAQELLPNTTLGTFLEHSKAVPAVGVRGKHPLKWDAVEKSTGNMDPLLRCRLC